jgi:hypothetical protein
MCGALQASIKLDAHINDPFKAQQVVLLLHVTTPGSLALHQCDDAAMLSIRQGPVLVAILCGDEDPHVPAARRFFGQPVTAG